MLCFLHTETVCWIGALLAACNFNAGPYSLLWRLILGPSRQVYTVFLNFVLTRRYFFVSFLR